MTFFYWSLDLVDTVLIQHSIHGLETRQELQRIAGTNAFWLTIPLPDEARLEYQYILRKGTQDILTLDPLNPNRAIHHGGEQSVCSLLGYAVPSGHNRATNTDLEVLNILDSFLKSLQKLERSASIYQSIKNTSAILY